MPLFDCKLNFLQNNVPYAYTYLQCATDFSPKAAKSKCTAAMLSRYTIGVSMRKLATDKKNKISKYTVSLKLWAPLQLFLVVKKNHSVAGK